MKITLSVALAFATISLSAMHVTTGSLSPNLARTGTKVRSEPRDPIEYVVTVKRPSTTTSNK